MSSYQDISVFSLLTKNLTIRLADESLTVTRFYRDVSLPRLWLAFGGLRSDMTSGTVSRAHLSETSVAATDLDFFRSVYSSPLPFHPHRPPASDGQTSHDCESEAGRTESVHSGANRPPRSEFATFRREQGLARVACFRFLLSRLDCMACLGMGRGKAVQETRNRVHIFERSETEKMQIFFSPLRRRDETEELWRLAIMRARRRPRSSCLRFRASLVSGVSCGWLAACLHARPLPATAGRARVAFFELLFAFFRYGFSVWPPFIFGR